MNDDLPADAPMLTDPDTRAAVRLLIAVSAAACLEEGLPSTLVTVARAVLCLKHGLSEMPERRARIVTAPPSPAPAARSS